MSGRPPSYLRSRHQTPHDTAPHPEATFQRQVVELLKWKQYPLVYHVANSRNSAPGFPDLIAVKLGHLVALELKSTRGKPTSEQLAWVAAMDSVAGIDAMVAHPKDLAAIERIL